MSYSPPDPFQHHHNTTTSNHARHPSLPTVYENNNDPYRIIKKSPRIGSISDNGSEFDAVHSRSASDSSTTRLLHTGVSTLPSLTSNAEFHDDPYASKKKWRSSATSSHLQQLQQQQQLQDERANSYLPYSHHKRDPNQKNEPIYIEEYSAPASTTLGMGSMLQDSMTDQIIRGGGGNGSYQPDRIEDPNHHNITDKMVNLQSEMKKKKRQRKRCCGFTYRTVAFSVSAFLVILALVIFFVWPRIPDLKLIDVDNISSIAINRTTKSYSTLWNLNITADNHANWVPTRISSIDFTFVDNETEEHFGNVTAGAMVLPPRADTAFNVTMPIYYESSKVNDTTFQNLYDACGVQVTSNTPSETQQDKLNVTLYVTYHIAGIAWPTRKQMKLNDLVCPTS